MQLQIKKQVQYSLRGLAPEDSRGNKGRTGAEDRLNETILRKDYAPELEVK
jgi:hypothetical protein